jgi:hypothetical protein
MLRRVFEPKRGEVTRSWRKLHNEELHDSYSSPSISRIKVMEDGIGREYSTNWRGGGGEEYL